jgi:hypothetical protein
LRLGGKNKQVSHFFHEGGNSRYYLPALWRMRNTMNAATSRMVICTLGRIITERRR